MRVRQTAVAAIAIGLWVAFLLMPQKDGPQTSQSAAVRTIEFATTHVTDASVAVSPDGRWLIITMLGHLFRLPATGGVAEQLTFGPHYDSEPVFSPDGRRVAFISDRDGSEGNVFLTDPTNPQIVQLTHERWAGHPTWTPDGQAIVYLNFEEVLGAGRAAASIRSAPLRGGAPITLVPARQLFRSPFYLQDGRLGWAVVEPGTASQAASSRLEVRSQDGTIRALRTLEGEVQRVVVAPTGDGLHCRILRAADRAVEDLVFVRLSDGAEMAFATLDRSPLPSLFSVQGIRPQSARFGVDVDNSVVYVGDAGRLWNISRATGSRQPIAFTAPVRLEVRDPIPPRPRSFPLSTDSVPPRTIVDPRLSPDGRFLIFGAAWHLWRQALDGGTAERLTQGAGFDLWPALSPDGQQIAFVHFEHGKEEVRLFDLVSRETRIVASGGSYLKLAWSPDGDRLAFVEEGSPNRIAAVNVTDGRQEKLADIGGWQGLRPHFSRDGRSIYFTRPSQAGFTLQRLHLSGTQALETLTEPEPLLRDGLVSPDQRWVVFRRGMEIWIAPFTGVSVDMRAQRRLSAEGGQGFAFTPDGSGVIYAAGSRVWTHPLGGGAPEELPLRLALERLDPPPVLLRRVRVLDFQSGNFGPETSLLLDEGRIRWIGSERGRPVPAETRVVDASGRYAIPGLFDMHVHSFRWFLVEPSPETVLAYGVTSVRDVGGRRSWLEALADRSEASDEPLPRYFFSGEFFSDETRCNEWSLCTESDEEARAYVRQWKEKGADFLKVSHRDRAVAEEAHLQDIPLVAHGGSVEEIVKRVTLGYTSLEHPTSQNSRVHDDVLRMMALAGTRWDPTLSVSPGLALMMRDQPELLADRKFRAFIPWGESRAALWVSLD